MTEKPYADATARNSEAILGAIREEFRGLESILEIGSGTGQHAVYFCNALDHVVWQTSDVRDNHGGIRAWLDDASLPNVLEPLTLDVLDAELPGERYDGVFSANTAHIMNLEAVQKMFHIVAGVLQDNGVFVLYGPFRQGRRFNTPSNAGFHRSLRQRDPGMGIRHLEELDGFAQCVGMRRKRLYAMPANNNLAVWVKKGGVAT
jgi:cyclopropane fatty-acyl-phospholipid synthase-like methyltransferase